MRSNQTRRASRVERGWRGLVPRTRTGQGWGMSRFVLLWFALALGSGLRADRAAEIAEIHAAVMGGRDRIEALRSFRAEGQVTTAAGFVRFTLVAARPNRVRLETERGGRTLVQAWDGNAAPWELDSGAQPPRYREIAAGAARTFMADAEFDDPLVAGPSRGYTLDFAGEFEAEGRRTLRILVTRRMVETFTLLVDEETTLILMRVEQRESAGGRGVRVTTHYADYRPVEGVLLPHTITLSVDGKVTQQTKILKVEANPGIDDAVFVRPAQPPAGQKAPVEAVRTSLEQR